MAIQPTDIKFYKSANAGSLGGAIDTSTGLLTSGAANNLWDDVTSGEAMTGDTEYRCIYVKNTHGSLTLQGAQVYIDATTGDANVTIAIGLDPAAVGSTATCTSADENTAPTGGTVTFSSPTTTGSALVIGDIAAGAYKAIWLRRTVAASASSASDAPSIRVFGDTAA